MGNCRYIAAISKESGCQLGPFLGELARLEGRTDLLDSCDLHHLEVDLGGVLGVNDFADRYAKQYPRPFCRIEKDLASFFWGKDEEILHAFLEEHIGTETTQPLFDKNVRYTFDEIAKFRRVGEQICDYYQSPEVMEYLDPLEKQIQKIDLRRLRQLIQNGSPGELGHAMRMAQAKLVADQSEFSRRAENRIRFWQWVDRGYNIGVRSALPILAGACVAVSAPPLAPAAVAMFAFADRAGEEGTLTATDSDYSAGLAAGRVLYHLPFALVQGYGFQWGAKAGSIIFTGSSFLEGAGEPFAEPVPLGERFLLGLKQGGFALAGVGFVKGMSRFFPRFSTERFGPSPDRDLRFRKPPVAEVVAPVVKAPPVVEAPAAPVLSIVTGQRVVLPPEKTGPNLPRRYFEKRPEPESGSARGPVRNPIRYAKEETPKAAEMLKALHPTIQHRLREKTDRILRALNEGLEITNISGVKSIKQSGNLFEARIIGPRKLRVYFEIAGSNGERKVRIFGYSFGDNKVQDRVLDLIDKRR